jgi:hypothetical protein
MWWQGVDKIQFGELTIKQVAEMLMKRKFEGDKPNAIRVATGLAHGGQRITFAQFSRLFSRCIFKGSLDSLADRLLHSVDHDESAPPGLEVSQHRRKLIMSGLGLTSHDFTKKEGEAVLKAVINYRKD